MEELSFSMKPFSGHFYGHFFIKTVRGPCITDEITTYDNDNMAMKSAILCFNDLP